MRLTRILGLAAAGLALAAVHATVLAQSQQTWTIVYAPGSVNIPTLSEWGMLALSALLAVAAVAALRNRIGGKTLLSIAFLCALVLGGVIGTRMIGEAQAGTCAAPPPLSSPTGGTLNFTSCSSGTVTNTSGVALRIVSITPASSDTTPNTPTCVQNLVLQAGQSCYIAATPPT